jgi:hypothetical protein
MDFLGIKVLEELQEEVCLVASNNKSKALLTLASLKTSLQLEEDSLEGQRTRQINHKITKEDYLGDNSHN